MLTTNSDLITVFQNSTEMAVSQSERTKHVKGLKEQAHNATVWGKPFFQATNNT